MPDGLNLFAADDAATCRIGAFIAEQLRPGDLVLLEGNLGAGKTALARAIIQSLTGDPELEVPSPTFLLVLPYGSGPTAILHADLYRLAGAADLEELGLFDDENAVLLVEWPDRAPGLATRADLIVDLEIPASGDGRSIGLHTPRDPTRLSGLGKTLAPFIA